MTIYLVDDLQIKETLTEFADIGDLILASDDTIQPCTGCFGCWVVTPGRCVIRDEGRKLALALPKHERLCLISQLTYGMVSPGVKRILDRGIGYLHSKFTIIKDEMHHKPRYDHALELRAYFYGTGDEEERELAEHLISRNGINLFVKDYEVKFYEDVKELVSCLSTF